MDNQGEFRAARAIAQRTFGQQEQPHSDSRVVGRQTPVDSQQIQFRTLVLGICVPE